MSKTLQQIADSLFDNQENLTKEQFVSLVASKGLKLADLADGDFVTKQKFEDHKAKYDKLKEDFDTLKASADPDKELVKSLTAERDNFKSKCEELTSYVEESKRAEILKSHKVDEKFQKFVSSEVSKLTSDSVDFDTACVKYLKDNPQYVAHEESGESGLLFGDKGDPSKQKSIFSDLNNFVRGV